MMAIDISRMIPIDDLSSSGLEYVDELKKLADEAISFISSHEWCKNIETVMIDRGWGFILAVFYIIIEPAEKHIPNSFWVIVGDIPPAYIDTEDNPNGACAIDGYVMEMQKWIDHVMDGKSVDNVIPVNAPPEKKYATMLQSRLNMIKEEILSYFQDELAVLNGIE